MRVAYSRMTSVTMRAALAFFFAIALGSCGAAGPRQAQEQTAEQSVLAIETAGGVQQFHVEVVKTPEAQSRGLMYRTTLASDAGMLFPFGYDGHRSFWMKNTILPLDIIFIRSTGEIVAIAEHTVPYSERPIA